MKPPRTREAEWHRRTAAKLFNDTWRFIVKKGRTPEEDDAMIGMAYASRYHWSVVGGPIELAIGEWQTSHVYAILGRAEPSLFHARRSLEICTEHGIGDFPLAYAHEALARAYALEGDPRARATQMKKARTAGSKIAETEERAQFFKDLRTVPRARRR